jgi:hypothetical protein
LTKIAFLLNFELNSFVRCCFPCRHCFAAGIIARDFDKYFLKRRLTKDNLVKCLVVFLANLLVKYQQMLNLVVWVNQGGGADGVGRVEQTVEIVHALNSILKTSYNVSALHRSASR